VDKDFTRVVAKERRFSASISRPKSVHLLEIFRLAESPVAG
jgi:hypothetical protein